MITSININNQKMNVREIDEQNVFNVRGIFAGDNITKIDPNFRMMSCTIKRNLSDDSFSLAVDRPMCSASQIKSLGGDEKAFGIFTSVNVDNKFFKNSFEYDHDNLLSTEFVHYSLFDSHPLSSINTFPIAVNWMFDKDGKANDDDEMVSGMVISPQIFPIQNSFQITDDEAILFKMVKTFNVRFRENAFHYSGIRETSGEDKDSPFTTNKTYSYMIIKMVKPKQDEYTKKVAEIYTFNDDNSLTNQDYLISSPKYNSKNFDKNTSNVHYEPESEDVTISLDSNLTRRGKFLGKVVIDQIPGKVIESENSLAKTDQNIGEIIPYDFKNESYKTELKINLNAILKEINLQNFVKVDRAFLDPMDGIVKLNVTQKIFTETNIFEMKTLDNEELKNIKDQIAAKQIIPLSSLESRSKNE